MVAAAKFSGSRERLRGGLGRSAWSASCPALTLIGWVAAAVRSAVVICQGDYWVSVVSALAELD